MGKAPSKGLLLAICLVVTILIFPLLHYFYSEAIMSWCGIPIAVAVCLILFFTRRLVGEARASDPHWDDIVMPYPDIYYEEQENDHQE